MSWPLVLTIVRDAGAWWRSTVLVRCARTRGSTRASGSRSVSMLMSAFRRLAALAASSREFFRVRHTFDDRSACGFAAQWSRAQPRSPGTTSRRMKWRRLLQVAGACPRPSRRYDRRAPFGALALAECGQLAATLPSTSPGRPSRSLDPLSRRPRGAAADGRRGHHGRNTALTPPGGSPPVNASLARRSTPRAGARYAAKRVTENGARSIVERPVAISSAIASAVIGASRMPLRKWPVASTRPRTGVAPSTGR